MKALLRSFAIFSLCLPAVALAQPANDTIDNAIVLTANPSVVTGSTVGATDDTGDAGTSSCGTAITTGGVWYRAFGSGGVMTATTCSALTTYDSKLSVFRGAPGTLSCVGGNDDDFSCPDGIFDSTFGWPSAPGESYYILVHGFGGAQGSYELTVDGVGSLPSDELRVNVIKTFTDGIDEEVDVTLTCNTGLPLQQTFTIEGGDPVGVTFVVTNIPDTGVDCAVTETGGPAGYTADLTGCSWTDLTGGYYGCQITNSAQDATFTVTKEWEIINDGGDAVDESAQVTIQCDSLITDSNGYIYDCGGGYWCAYEYLGDGDSLWVDVSTLTGDAYCSVSESIGQSGVVSDADDCFSRFLSAGSSDSCVIYNTVFFEGIPTLSQYGLAIMALLMLGMGFIGFRRFA